MFSVAPLCAGYDATCWVHPDDRALLADPLAGMSADTEALLAQLGGAGTAFTEPDDVRLLADGVQVEVAGLELGALHAPGHTPGSTMFRTRLPAGRRTSTRCCFSGDVLFAGSVGRTDLPGGSAEAMAGQPADQGAAAARLGGRPARPRPADHDGRGAVDATPTCRRPTSRIGAGREPPPRRCPGFPELHAGAAHRRAAGARPAARGLRAVRLRARSRPARSSRWTRWPSRARSTRRSTRSSASPPSPGSAAELGLHFDLTVPFARYVLEHAHQLAFPFRRYQIQKVWRGERPQEGRYREFTQADVDIVNPGTLPAHFDVELPLVTLAALERLHVDLGLPPVLMRVNNRLLAQGFYRGLGIEDTVAVLRQVDKLDKIGPDRVRRRCWTTDVGVTPAQAAGVRTARRDLQRRRVVRRRRPGARASPTRCSTRASSCSPTSCRPPARTCPAGSSPTSRSPAASTTTPARSTRPSSSATRAAARSPPAGATTRWPATARRPTRASGCRSASPGCWCRCSAAGCCARPGRCRPAWWSRSTPSEDRPRVVDGGRGGCGPGASRPRWRPKAAKFGRQIRYADRRGIPYVWFGAGPEGGRRGQGHPVRRPGAGRPGPLDSPGGRPPSGGLGAPRSRSAANVNGRGLGHRGPKCDGWLPGRGCQGGTARR